MISIQHLADVFVVLFAVIFIISWTLWIIIKKDDDNDLFK
jgi:hypothetical protein